MPSLNALKEFKASFQNIGNEAKTLAELKLPIDDLTLPDKEPVISAGEPPSAEPGFTPAAEETPIDIGAPLTDFPAEQTAEPTTEPAIEPTTDTDFFPDLNDLLGGDVDDKDQGKTESEDFSDMLPDDFPTEETPATETGLSEDLQDQDLQLEGIQSQDTVPAGDDFNLPSELLDGFADEIEAKDTSPGEEAPSDLGADDMGGLDESFTDFEDLGLSNESPGDTSNQELGLESSDAFDLGDFTEPSAEETPAAEEEAATPDEAVAPSDEAVAPSDKATDETSFDFELPEEFPVSEDTGTGGDEPLDLGLDDMGGQDESPGGFDDLGLSSEGPGDTTDQELGLESSDAFDLGDIPEFPVEGEETPASEDAISFPDEMPLDETQGSDEIESLFDTDAGAGGMPISYPAADDISDLKEPLPEDVTLTDDLSDDEDSFDYSAGIIGNDTDAILEEVPGDSFDSFSLDSGLLVGDMDFEGGFGDDLDRLEDISIPGLDEEDEEALTGIPGRGKAKVPEAEEIEEINLSPEELEKLLTTLSSFPLNLRVACEECIAEELVEPALMSQLIHSLIDGAPAEEIAALASKILERHISIPKGYEKSSGEALEAEQASFPYIFVHNFLPVLARFMIIAGILFCLGYLVWELIYTPIRAEQIYKLGIERIDAGEYTRANERFLEAYNIRPKKPWFYTYARAFRDARQYTLAEEKYKELLYFTASKNKQHIPEKAAVLEYADMETRYIGDYQAADSIIRNNILVYNPQDRDALLALANNSLEWGDYEPERLEDARENFAKLMERYGRTDPLMEGMLKYFIRTDQLGFVISSKDYFRDSRRKISAATLAEMSGYLLDKLFEEVRGVPNEYLDYLKDHNTLIEIRQMLLRAINENQLLPESYYHLSRYYNYLENKSDEAYTLEVAVQAFEYSREESPKRIGYHIKTLQRYAEIQTDRKEFFPAEETLIKGINLYENALSRRILKQAPEYGRLYTDLGDLEYFVQDGDMQNALDYYSLGEQNGWAPPEIQYRMGAAHYQLRQWGPALERFYAAYREMSPNRRILYALGNVSYMRGNYFAAQGYYDKLLEILEADRARLPPIMATNNAEQLDLAERLMIVQNNLGVTLEALSERTGDNSYRSRALGLYSDSERAWDVLTRNPTTMIRMRPSPDISAPSVNPAYLNVQNSLRPVPDYQPQIFLRIDRDLLESSEWEDLTPAGYSLSQGIYTGR
jgi:tetratricopeptide (TPR) repeat protein